MCQVAGGIGFGMVRDKNEVQDVELAFWDSRLTGFFSSARRVCDFVG